MQKAIYPGYFKKFNKGHLWVLKRSLEVFDYIYVIVSWNHLKDNQNIDQRYKRVKDFLKNYENVKVIINRENNIFEITKQLKCNFIIRGIRNQEDYLYEEELLANNLYFNKNIRCIYFINTQPKNTAKYVQFKNTL